MEDSSDIPDLKRSSQRVGRLYPVLLDKNGIVVDGQHRLATDAAWPTVRLDHISTEKERLLARLISNVCRRTVTYSEKKEIITQLAKICLKEGETAGELVNTLGEITGMSYRWVMKYLPQEYKQRPGLGGPAKGCGIDESKVRVDKSKVARHATGLNELLLSNPIKKFVLIRNYKNTGFVNVLLERDFYDKLITSSTILGISLEAVINNVMIFALKELESMARSQERENHQTGTRAPPRFF